jgi:hypothetical protein
MQSENSVIAAMKLAVSWILVTVGNVTATQVATYLAIAYTGAQLYVLFRDKIINRRNA